MGLDIQVYPLFGEDKNYIHIKFEDGDKNEIVKPAISPLCYHSKM